VCSAVDRRSNGGIDGAGCNLTHRGGPVMIARRPKSGVTPSDVQEVRRRFHDIIRKAAHMAEAPSKHAAAWSPRSLARARY